MTRPSRKLRRALADLERARDALARAKESGADPWRVSELQLRHDRLQDVALSADAELTEDHAPAPHMRAPAVPPPPPTRVRKFE